MPIEEEQENKWDNQRIAAYKRHVENSEKQIMKLASDYINAQKSLREIIECIEREKQSKENPQKELYDLSGWMINDGEWIDVDKQ